MTPALTITPSDYLAIARLITDTPVAGAGNHNYEVVYKSGGYALYLDVLREIAYHNEIGGSYGGYAFERLSVIDRDDFDILGYTCVDSSGDYADCDFTVTKLLETIFN